MEESFRNRRNILINSSIFIVLRLTLLPRFCIGDVFLLFIFCYLSINLYNAPPPRRSFTKLFSKLCRSFHVFIDILEIVALKGLKIVTSTVTLSNVTCMFQRKNNYRKLKR